MRLVRARGQRYGGLRLIVWEGALAQSDDMVEALRALGLVAARETVRVTPLVGGGDHVEIEVRREGELIREPVEIAVVDRAGVTQTLRWDDATTDHRFSVDLPARLKSVEIDPRERLVETALGSLRPSDDPRYDNRRPSRWRLLYEGFGALLNITALTANFEAAFLLKPQHDLRHAVLLTAYHSEATDIGAGGA